MKLFFLCVSVTEWVRITLNILCFHAFTKLPWCNETLSEGYGEGRRGTWKSASIETLTRNEGQHLQNEDEQMNWTSGSFHF